MAHQLDFTGNRANIAFIGSRRDVWHRLGTEMQAGQSIEAWSKAAGLDWHARKVPSYADVSTNGTPDFQLVPGWNHIVRSDNNAPLGYVSEAGYKLVQPAEVLDWFQRYIAVDDRFELDVAGSLRGGGRIWATARYNGEISVGGDAHRARVLMCTGFDGTLATTNSMTMTRVVCNNTLTAALCDKRALIKTSHAARFDAAAVGRELSGLAQSVETFKAIGDAMAAVELSVDDTRKLFKKILAIPFDAKPDEVSTRKMNQFHALSGAYSQTVAEGTERGKVWTALNAVTRYVDHERSSRNGDSEESGRFDSAQFGSGANLKAIAWNMLVPMVKDRVAA